MLRDQIAIRRSIINACEEQLNSHDHLATDWPVKVIETFQILGALTLPYELHQHWREEWRP